MLQQTDQTVINQQQEDSLSSENSVNQDENEQKGKLGQSRTLRVPNGINNRKRRQIKMEREEILSLFNELVCLINNKVIQIQNQGEKSKNLPNPNIALKAKRSMKFKKDEPEKILIPPRITQDPLMIRKNSIKDDKISIQRLEKQKKKKQILQNYSLFMKYKIIDQNEQQITNNRIILNNSASSPENTKNQSKGIKPFSVFQQVSLTINPITTNSN